MIDKNHFWLSSHLNVLLIFWVPRDGWFDYLYTMGWVIKLSESLFSLWLAEFWRIHINGELFSSAAMSVTQHDVSNEVKAQKDCSIVYIKIGSNFASSLMFCQFEHFLNPFFYQPRFEFTTFHLLLQVTVRTGVRTPHLLLFNHFFCHRTNSH